MDRLPQSLQTHPWPTLGLRARSLTNMHREFGPVSHGYVDMDISLLRCSHYVLRLVKSISLLIWGNFENKLKYTHVLTSCYARLCLDILVLASIGINSNEMCPALVYSKTVVWSYTGIKNLRCNALLQLGNTGISYCLNIFKTHRSLLWIYHLCLGMV